VILPLVKPDGEERRLFSEMEKAKSVWRYGHHKKKNVESGASL